MSLPAGVTISLRSWLLAGLAIASAGLGLQLASSSRGLQLPLYDFAEYWAAGRLLWRGENPYDPALVGQLEAELGRDGEPLLMWNPPWTLPFVLPFGLLPPGLAHILWLLASFATILAAADVGWRLYGGSPERRGIAWVLAITFVPTFLTLYLGQIAALPLAGAVLFLHFERRGQYLLAGACTLLMAVKPHLFSVFWLALLFWSPGRRRWRVLAGAGVAVSVATLTAMIFAPAVLSQYRDVLTNTPPVQYRSPTAGTVIRLLFGENRFGLQFMAIVPGFVWFAYEWHRHRLQWDWGLRLPSLLFASLLTAPYGAWPFDLVVLLIPMLRVAADTSGSVGRGVVPASLYVAANVVSGVFVLATVDFFWWIWLAPALALAYAAALRKPRALAGGVLLTGDGIS
jgi:hypothetical protein